MRFRSAKQHVHRNTRRFQPSVHGLELRQLLSVTVGDSGFESPSVGSGGIVTDPTGTPWTFTDSAGITGNGSGFTVGNANAPEGQQVAYLQNQGAISQSVANWSAGSYVLSVVAAERANYGGTNQSFQVLVDGNVVGTIQPATTSYQTYTTSSFTVTAGTHTIAFQGLNASGDSTVLIDAIVIAPPPTSLGVPIFTLDPAFAVANNQARARGDVTNNNPNLTDTASDTLTNGPGASEQTPQLTGDPIYQNPPPGAPVTPHIVTVSDRGTVNTTAKLPLPGVNTGTSSILLKAEHQHVNTVQTDANGPYDLDPSDFVKTNMMTDMPVHALLSGPAGNSTPVGTVTISFDAKISARDTSGPHGTERFERSAALDLQTNYVNIQIEPNNDGVVVSDASSGQICAQSSSFASDGQHGAAPGETLYFQWTMTLPALPTLTLGYYDEFDTRTVGTFGGDETPEYAAQPANFGWDFSITANG